MEKLKKSLLLYSKYPSDLINIIIQYTLCNCTRSINTRIIRIQQAECFYCGEKVSSIIKDINKTICRRCRHTVYFSSKSCKICHDCIIENHTNPVECLDCDNIFYKMKP